MNSPHSFSVLLDGEPVQLPEFEKELSNLILNMNSDSSLNAQKMQDTITDALKRRCCSGSGPKAAIHMHMRMKKGLNPDATLNQDELNDIADILLSSNKNQNNKIADILKQLSNFYVRLANLRTFLLHQQQKQHQQHPPQQQSEFIADKHLKEAYSQSKENMYAKQRENQEHFARIMQNIIMDDRIHPDLTDADLATLETQAHHLVESGCATHELRSLKIMEAAIEQQKYDALIAELNALDE